MCCTVRKKANILLKILVLGNGVVWCVVLLLLPGKQVGSGMQRSYDRDEPLSEERDIVPLLSDQATQRLRINFACISCVRTILPCAGLLLAANYYKSLFYKR